MDRIMRQWAVFPGMHVYHYAPYEPAAFKRLMGRYATRATDLDALLRGGRFVDLYAAVKQGPHVGVERYSIKNLEPAYGYVRDVDLMDAQPCPAGNGAASAVGRWSTGAAGGAGCRGGVQPRRLRIDVAAPRVAGVGANHGDRRWSRPPASGATDRGAGGARRKGGTG
ncbi:MAG: ribonuclease H-like domain-containing protein [Gemmatimonadetes bacterium]|nr:ribonuclease H-like domain-containing protein [Gemmatimonadota bacterium]